ncbi:MAG: tetratricopeptide repeat protein [Phycisphaerae bacterium]|nr:tetratricopeptide repeat protein [Phycisphaerae bacterium]
MERDAAACRVPRLAPTGVVRDKYRLVARLGQGAHGTTYLAEHLFLSHPCVVKVLTSAISGPNAEWTRAIREEARLGYRVHHPNVVRVLDCDSQNDVWYFVMEFVEGVSLHGARAAAPTWPWRQVQKFAIDIASGLAAIHALEIVHHDIKPGNLLLGVDGVVRVADLGVARLSREQPRRTDLGYRASEGTLHYAAPERLQADATVDARADQYSLGVTLFELLVGRSPFENSSFFVSLLQQQNEAPRWPDDRLDAAPEWMRRTILRLLSADPARRYSSAEAVARAFSEGDDASGVQRMPPTAQSAPPARGVGLLPLENRTTDAGQDWVGFAIVDGLARILARRHGLYIVDAERIHAGLRDTGPQPLSPMVQRYRAAAARHGAGTLIGGEYEARGEQLIVRLRLHSTAAAPDEPPRVLEAQGAIASIGALQEALQAKIAEALQLDSADTGPAAPVAAPQHQAAYVGAKQAYLRGAYEDAIRESGAVVAAAPDFAEAVALLGVCCARAGRYAEAELHHRRLAEIASQRGDVRMMVEAQANLGVMHYFQGTYDAALTHYTDAARDAEAFSLPSEAAQIHNNLGFVLLRLGRHAEAEVAFRKAIDMHQRFGAALALIGPFNGLGNVLTFAGRYAEASGYFRRALALSQEIGDRTNIGTSHMNLGHCAALQRRFVEAGSEFAMALNALQETTFWNGLARLYELMAEMNQRLGHFREALRCAEQRAQLARQHGNKRIESLALEQQALALAAMGQHPRAEEVRAAAKRLA